MQTDAVAVQIGDVGEEIHARRQSGARLGNLPALGHGALQRSVQRGRCVQVAQHGFVKSLGGVELGGGDFKPAGGFFIKNSLLP